MPTPATTTSCVMDISPGWNGNGKERGATAPGMHSASRGLPVRENGCDRLWRLAGRVPHLRQRAAEARRGRGLRHAVDLDECLARPVVWVGGRFVHVEHRREADVGAF